MIARASLLAVLAAVPMLAGCGSTRPVEMKPMPAEDQKMFDRGIVNTDRALGGAVEARDVGVERTADGRLALDLGLYNVSGDYVRVDYRVRFLTESGAPIADDPEQGPVLKTLQRGLNHVLVYSRTKQAARYEIQIDRRAE